MVKEGAVFKRRWRAKFIKGNRNAFISERAPSPRVRGFTHCRYCLGFPSFAESVHKGPVWWLFGMQTHARGAGVSPSKLWDVLSGRCLLLGWDTLEWKVLQRVFFKASGLLSYLVLSLLCSHFVVLINFMITQQTCFYSVCCCGS